MALTFVEEQGGNTSLDNIDFGVPLTAESLYAQTQPTANTNGTSGFSFNDAVNSILGMFDKGVEAYQSVNTAIGQTKANAEANKAVVAKAKQVNAPQVLPANDASIIPGVSNTTLLWVAGGLTAVLLISMFRRR